LDIIPSFSTISRDCQPPEALDRVSGMQAAS